MRRSEILEKYHNYLLLERGLSSNTREAYLRDVGKYVS